MDMIRKHLGALAALLLAAILILCVLLLPRGRYLPERMQNETSFDISGRFNGLMESRLTDVKNDAAGIPRAYSLPVDSSPAPRPRQSGYSSYEDDEGVTHSTYEDETISVDLWSFDIEVRGKTSVVHAAKVKIASPTQLRTAFAGGQYSLTEREFTSKIAADNNAVIAINADMYNYSTEGLLIRQGVQYRNLGTGWQMLFIDSEGDMHIKTNTELRNTDFLETHEIYNSFVFGPALVKDGEIKLYKQGDSGLRNNSFFYNPRTAIGQTAKLEYVLVMVEGRGDQSYGVRLDALAEVMYDLGCVQAYNLDGGQSSAIVMNDKLMNVPSNGAERSVSEIIYFASALPEE